MNWDQLEGNWPQFKASVGENCGALLIATTTADLLFDRLARWGVSMVFGLAGDGINGLEIQTGSLLARQ